MLFSSHRYPPYCSIPTFCTLVGCIFIVHQRPNELLPTHSKGIAPTAWPQTLTVYTPIASPFRQSLVPKRCWCATTLVDHLFRPSGRETRALMSATGRANRSTTWYNDLMETEYIKEHKYAGIFRCNCKLCVRLSKWDVSLIKRWAHNRRLRQEMTRMERLKLTLKEWWNDDPAAWLCLSAFKIIALSYTFWVVVQIGAELSAYLLQ